MSRPFSIAKQNKVLNACRDFVIANGAVKNPEHSWHQYSLQTSAGVLQISFDVGFTLASIFMSFDEPKRAVEILGCRINQHSGKWNFHCSAKDDAENFIGVFRGSLSLVKKELQS